MARRRRPKAKVIEPESDKLADGWELENSFTAAGFGRICKKAQIPPRKYTPLLARINGAARRYRISMTQGAWRPVKTRGPLKKLERAIEGYLEKTRSLLRHLESLDEVSRDLVDESVVLLAGHIPDELPTEKMIGDIGGLMIDADRLGSAVKDVLQHLPEDKGGPLEDRPLNRLIIDLASIYFLATGHKRLQYSEEFSKFIVECLDHLGCAYHSVGALEERIRRVLRDDWEPPPF